VCVVITSCVGRRQRKMYCGHPRLCVCVSVCLPAAVRPHYCTDPDVTWGRGRGCPLIVHNLADLQSGHGLRCYGNITRTLVQECSLETLVLVSRRLEDMKNGLGLGLGLDEKVSIFSRP